MPSVSSQPPELRARAYSAAGGIAYWRSNAQDTYRYYDEALGLARSADDRALLAAALYDAGFAPVPGETTQRERMRLGQPMWEEALAIFRDLGDEAGVASSLWALSMSAAANEDLERRHGLRDREPRDEPAAGRSVPHRLGRAHGRAREPHER